MCSHLNGPLQDPSETPASAAGALPSGVPLHEALALTKGGGLAGIELNGQVYALRITRQGRLLLTK
ncbi:hemin uptake protein HemP [Falsigemmobacter faecalis]|uniref:Hemin uptake protein HemP n=2 Tax=Falsigemmobacter faecalis TaxID=2488730 RepID=A0A3P3DS61_9RHOB|nr:hemin uptake protein HemP [Falsigemmobacter faecalis]RRH75518.1 hemin uptake protein HemP [Falsigemmobacter faecalis]